MLGDLEFTYSGIKFHLELVQHEDGCAACPMEGALCAHAPNACMSDPSNAYIIKRVEYTP